MPEHHTIERALYMLGIDMIMMKLMDPTTPYHRRSGEHSQDQVTLYKLPVNVMPVLEDPDNVDPLPAQRLVTLNVTSEQALLRWNDITLAQVMFSSHLLELHDVAPPPAQMWTWKNEVRTLATDPWYRHANVNTTHDVAQYYMRQLIGSTWDNIRVSPDHGPLVEINARVYGLIPLFIKLNWDVGTNAEGVQLVDVMVVWPSGRGLFTLVPVPSMSDDIVSICDALKVHPYCHVLEWQDQTRDVTYSVEELDAAWDHIGYHAEFVLQRAHGLLELLKNPTDNSTDVWCDSANTVALRIANQLWIEVSFEYLSRTTGKSSVHVEYSIWAQNKAVNFDVEGHLPQGHDSSKWHEIIYNMVNIHDGLSRTELQRHVVNVMCMVLSKVTEFKTLCIPQIDVIKDDPQDRAPFWTDPALLTTPTASRPTTGPMRRSDSRQQAPTYAQLASLPAELIDIVRWRWQRLRNSDEPFPDVDDPQVIAARRPFLRQLSWALRSNSSRELVFLWNITTSHLRLFESTTSE